MRRLRVRGRIYHHHHRPAHRSRPRRASVLLADMRRHRRLPLGGEVVATDHRKPLPGPSVADDAQRHSPLNSRPRASPALPRSTCRACKPAGVSGPRTPCLLRWGPSIGSTCPALHRLPASPGKNSRARRQAGQHAIAVNVEMTVGRNPKCDAPPTIGALRAEEGGKGGKRTINDLCAALRLVLPSLRNPATERSGPSQPPP